MNKSIVKKNADILHFMCRATPRVRNKLIRHLPKEVVDAISEVASNIFLGHVPMSVSQRKSLLKHRTKLHELRKKRGSVKHKKRILQQKGGFIGALAAVLAPLAIKVLSGIVS